MNQAAAPRQASKTAPSRHTALAAGPRGIALAPPDYGIDFVDHLPANDGPVQNNGRPRVLQQKTLLDDSSNSRRVVQQTVDLIASSRRVLQQKALFDSVTNSRRLIAQTQPEKPFRRPGSTRGDERIAG